MRNYSYFDKKNITGLEQGQIEELYDKGYVLTRLPEMHQVRSLRIDLSKFELSSENRRIMRKNEDLDFFIFDLPLPANPTNWQIHALGKNFYKEKFQDVEFSASRIRQIIGSKKSKFNSLFVYYANNTLPNDSTSAEIDYVKALGFCISFKTGQILHYSYPFYQLDSLIPNLGLGMMLKAILWAKGNGIKYIYLGSFSRPTDKYKLQFKGLEWWDKDNWSQDIQKMKRAL